MTKRCFVIQGFGKKQDYEQGKQFDLDASYEVIKEAMEDAGLECYRADELRTAGLIDQVMYDQLLEADLVVADITTLNFNAAYELGVRLALRPRATIIVGEIGMNFPFDVNHIYVHTYKHLGDDIGRREARRFHNELKEQAQKIIDASQSDSPVYKFLNQLPENGFINVAEPARKTAVVAKSNISLRELIDEAREAMQKGHFTEAVDKWHQAREISVKDDYLVQQHALATYKSEQPNAQTALRRAEEILEYLQPHGSFDTETLGLWAAVHKRLFEITGDADDLEEALFALERGFFMKQDYYNGINLAYMLDIKASINTTTVRSDELRAFARYVRHKVINICKTVIESDETNAEDEMNDEDKYWVLATFYEAFVGLGQEENAQRWKGEAGKLSVPGWMFRTTEEQITRLRALLS